MSSYVSLALTALSVVSIPVNSLCVILYDSSYYTQPLLQGGQISHGSWGQPAEAEADQVQEKVGFGMLKNKVFQCSIFVFLMNSFTAGVHPLTT